MTNTEIIDRIRQLKKEKKCRYSGTLLYSSGGSGYSRLSGGFTGIIPEAGKTDARIIVFAVCILWRRPQRSFLRTKDPDSGFRSRMFTGWSITGYELREWKKANPDGIIVSYVNTTAEVKAWTDICCTSANALKVVQSIPPDHKILFVPDKNPSLGSGKLPDGKWNSGMEIVVYTNASPPTWSPEKSRDYPQADILIHPESHCSHDEAILNLPQALYVLDGRNDQTCKPVGQKQFIIATEIETIHKLKNDKIGQRIYSGSSLNHLWTNEKITLGSVLEALEKEQYVVEVAEDIRQRARAPYRGENVTNQIKTAVFPKTGV